jgi:hypothetical protein
LPFALCLFQICLCRRPIRIIPRRMFRVLHGGDLWLLFFLNWANMPVNAHNNLQRGLGGNNGR